MADEKNRISSKKLQLFEIEDPDVLSTIEEANRDYKATKEIVKQLEHDINRTENIVNEALEVFKDFRDIPKVQKNIRRLEEGIGTINVAIESLKLREREYSNLKLPTRPQIRDYESMVKPETRKRYRQQWDKHHARRKDHASRVDYVSTKYREESIYADQILKNNYGIISNTIAETESLILNLKEQARIEQLEKSKELEEKRQTENEEIMKDVEDPNVKKLDEMTKATSQLSDQFGDKRHRDGSFSLTDQIAKPSITQKDVPNIKFEIKQTSLDTDSEIKEDVPQQTEQKTQDDESKDILKDISDNTNKTANEVAQLKENIKDKDKEEENKKTTNEKNKIESVEGIKEESKSKKLASMLTKGLGKTFTTTLKVATAPAFMILNGMHGMLKGIYNSRLMGVAKLVAIVGGILYAIDWVRVLLNRWKIDMSEDYQKFVDQYGRLAPIIESLVKFYEDMSSYFKGEKSIFDGQDVTLTKLFLDAGDVLLTALSQGMDFLLEGIGLFIHNMNPFNKKITMEQYRYKRAEEKGLGLDDVNWNNRNEIRYSLLSKEAKRRSKYHDLFSSDLYKDESGDFDTQKAMEDLRKSLKNPIIGKIALDLEEQARNEFGLTRDESKEFLKNTDSDTLKWISNKLIKMQNELWDLEFDEQSMDIIKQLTESNASIVKAMATYGEGNVLKVINDLGVNEDDFNDLIESKLRSKVKSGKLNARPYQAKSIGLDMVDGIVIDKIDSKHTDLGNAQVVTDDKNLSNSLILNNQRKNEIMEELVKPQEQKQEQIPNIVNISANQNNQTVNAHTPDAILAMFGNKIIVS